MIEKEIKFMLTKTDYEKLLTYLQEKGFKTTSINIENHYFDTDKLELLNTGVALRIRKLESVWIFTYKCRIKGKLYEQRRDGVLINEEIEEVIDEEIAKKILNGEKDIWSLEFPFLERLKNELKSENKNWWKDVASIGFMKVLRTKTTLVPYNIPWEIDKIEYGNGDMEYELESETDNLELAESLIYNIFSRIKIVPNPAKAPKIVRFLAKTGYRDILEKEWEL